MCIEGIACIEVLANGDIEAKIEVLVVSVHCRAIGDIEAALNVLSWQNQGVPRTVKVFK